jgi:RecA/RadA recombinase
MSNSALVMALSKFKERINITTGDVLIIDSINNYYRYEQGDKNISYHNTRNTFMSILNKINDLTKKFGLITIATAQISPNFIDNAIIKEKPVGNQFLNHFFSEYLYLSSRDKDSNYIHLVNSSFLPEKRVSYKITPGGIEDHSI